MKLGFVCIHGQRDLELQTSGPNSKEKRALMKSGYCVWQCLTMVWLFSLNLDRKSEALDPSRWSGDVILKGTWKYFNSASQSHCGPTQLNWSKMAVDQFQSGSLELWIGPWISSNGALLKFQSFWSSFPVYKGDKNKGEEDFQQNNMRVRVCDCRLPDSDSTTGYLKAVKSW